MGYDLSEFKKIAIEAVKKAEERIMYYFHNLPPIEKKVDMTPVTKADKEAEEIIVETIRKKYPNHGFLGEEFGSQNNRAEFVWIIDPIDGTKKFIHGIDFWGTVVGLKFQGKIILGVSNMPSLNELLFASEEEPTTLNGKQVRVSKVSSLENAFVSIGGISKLNRSEYVNALIEIERATHNIRGYGDVHGYQLVATGRADIMLEPAAKPWDLSAFQIILKQAGGKFSDFSGDELALGPSALATNGLLHGEILSILKQVGVAK